MHEPNTCRHLHPNKYALKHDGVEEHDQYTYIESISYHVCMHPDQDSGDGSILGCGFASNQSGCMIYEASEEEVLLTAGKEDEEGEVYSLRTRLAGLAMRTYEIVYNGRIVTSTNVHEFNDAEERIRSKFHQIVEHDDEVTLRVPEQPPAPISYLTLVTS